jgi:hypothetical protein
MKRNFQFSSTILRNTEADHDPHARAERRTGGNRKPVLL